MAGLSPAATLDEILAVNESVNQTIQTALKTQMLLQSKLDSVIQTPVLTGPPGPAGPTGPAGGATGVCDCPSIMAEIEGTGLQNIANGTTQAINFTGGTIVGDGTVVVSGTNTILPETGAYVICYTISGNINATGDTSAAGMTARLQQLNTGGTFNQQVVGSFTAININGNNTALLADGSISNCTLVCVAETGGGNLNNIIQLIGGTQNAQGAVTAINFQGAQTSVTVTKYSDEICG
ncbi:MULTISPECIES: hypothetical protein [Bacillus cereus group]|uniref:hypothetical protein n=1 Tax=Bacillus cereus group TaxID=86661 RepID=UPI00211E62D5|nr:MULTISPECIES: hypothetical protein [Bacillus cereus group]